MPDKPKKKRQQRKNQFTVRRGVLPPSAQVQHFSPDQWEKFIEAACALRPLDAYGLRYASVKRLGGSGDGGRDVEARLDNNLLANQWDLYQAKHYNAGLTPSEFFPELAKFFLNLQAGTYPQPRAYYLCAPLGAGNDLHNLLTKPHSLKARFLDDWANGRTGFKGRSNELTTELKNIIQAFEFERIHELALRDLLQWHEINRRPHFELFGIEPERGDDPQTPHLPSQNEQVYVEELIRVYEEHIGRNVTLQDVIQDSVLREHFQDQRSLFYCAEGLRIFSRDLFGKMEFDALLNMVLTGLRPQVNSLKHRTGMERLEAGINGASTLKVSDSILAPKLRPGDLPGTCHHLANQRKFTWVK